jgi:hypothetical protein
MAISNGAVGVREPYELKDEHGVVVLATVKTVLFSHFQYTDSFHHEKETPHTNDN